MGFKLTVSLQQGTNLLRMSHGAKWPEKVGDKTFTPGMQATFNKEFRALYKALKKHSPLLTGKDRKLFFGPAEAYKRIERKTSDLPTEIAVQVDTDEVKVSYECTDRTREVELELSGDARKGVYRVLYLQVHPSSGACLGPGAQEEVAWPVAEKLGCVRQLEEDTGVKKGETIEVKWDDEFAADDAKKDAAEKEKQVEEARN